MTAADVEDDNRGRAAKQLNAECKNDKADGSWSPFLSALPSFQLPAYFNSAHLTVDGYTGIISYLFSAPFAGSFLHVYVQVLE